MALSNLFRINFPYGIQFDTKKETFCFFNREYTQLGGLNAGEDSVLENIGVRYYGLTPEIVIDIVGKHTNKKSVSVAKVGDIIRVFFYDDSTNPSNKGNSFTSYFNIIKELSNYRVSKFYTNSDFTIEEVPM